jgi:hypothetical protein
MNLREAAQQALDELIAADGMPICNETDILDLSKTIDALRAALAEDAMQRLTDVQQEMEATINEMETVWNEYPIDTDTTRRPMLMTVGDTLARAGFVKKQKPLTDGEIEQLMKWPEKGTDLLDFARAIEAKLKEKNS